MTAARIGSDYITDRDPTPGVTARITSSAENPGWNWFKSRSLPSIYSQACGGLPQLNRVSSPTPFFGSDLPHHACITSLQTSAQARAERYRPSEGCHGVVKLMLPSAGPWSRDTMRSSMSHRGALHRRI